MKRKIIGKTKILVLWAAAVAALIAYGCGESGLQDNLPEADNAAQTSADGTKVQKTDGQTDSQAGGEYRESLMECDKEELVYALADAYGEPYEITVRTTLRCPDSPDRSSTISDYTLLADIKNKEGDENFTLAQDGSLTWENHGSDIQYEGTADKELPVSVKITYYLDGREVPAQELAGAQGRIKVRFDYENHSGSGKDMIPFTAISGMLLSGDQVSEIEVSDGKIKSMNGDALVTGMIFPGMEGYLKTEESTEGDKADKSDFPQFWEVSFDAVDFSMDFTATVIVNGLLAEMDLEDLFEKAEKTSEGYGNLDDGTGGLEDGLRELSGHSPELVSGAKSLQSGLESLNAAIAALPQDDPAVLQLKAAVETLSSGSAKLTTGVRNYTDGVNQLYEGVAKLSDGTSKMAESGDKTADLAEQIKTLQETDRTYDNYGGIAAGKTGSVMFVIETDEIE